MIDFVQRRQQKKSNVAIWRNASVIVVLGSLIGCAHIKDGRPYDSGDEGNDDKPSSSVVLKKDLPKNLRDGINELEQDVNARVSFGDLTFRNEETGELENFMFRDGELTRPIEGSVNIEDYVEIVDIDTSVRIELRGSQCEVRHGGGHGSTNC